MITVSESNILQHFSEESIELVRLVIRKQNNLPISRKYNPSLRKFALSLHFYSRAYDFVRYKFNNVLPHAKTISKWYCSIDGEVGILTEALHAIKLHVQSVSYKLIDALVFDEMAIRQHVDFSKDKFVGYVDWLR